MTPERWQQIEEPIERHGSDVPVGMQHFSLAQP